MTTFQILLLILILSAISPITAGGESRKITNLCSVVHPGDAAFAWDCRRIGKGETPEALFGDRWLDVLRFNRIDRRHLTAGVSIRVPRNLDDIVEFSPLPDTYPPADQHAKFILVDMTEQFLGAYENGERVFSFPVASGNRKNRTPVGDFRITAFNRRHRYNLYWK
jgi:hypothetical protein